MGQCATADGADDGSGPSAELEAAAAEADGLADVAADPQEEIDRRAQEIEVIFKEILSRPRLKPAFDPANPNAHNEVEPEPEPVDDSVAAAPPPAPMMPPGAEEEAAPPPPDETEIDSDDVSMDEDDDETDSDEEEEEANEPVPPLEEMEDILELCGGKEIWEDIDEMREDESAATILGKAGEHTSCYPWAKAHFVKLCFMTEKPPDGAGAGGEGDAGAAPDAGADAEGGGGGAWSPPMDNYVTGVLRLREALSHIQRANDRLRVNMAKDVAELCFNEEGEDPAARLGLDMMGLESKEAAIAKMTNMSDGGCMLMISRVEERIDQELLPAYYKAYDAVGDKESLAYPEEVCLMEQYYPFVDEQSDEEAQSQLDLVIHKAKDVLDMDGGSSDCYVKAVLGDETFLTDVRGGTLNPMWEKAMKFDVDAEERKKMSLWLKMYDEDMGDDEFMGMCKVRLHDLIKDGPAISQWVKLTDMKGGTKTDRGEIFISLRFGEPTEGDAMSSEDNLSCVPLAQVPGYKLTRIQINFCATKVQKVWRGVMSRGGSAGLKGAKSAEHEAMVAKVVNVQRKWRAKRAWARIKAFTGSMKKGTVFMKIAASGKKKEKRHLYCPPPMNTLFWRDPESDEEGTPLAVNSIVAILSGRISRTFKKYDARCKADGVKFDKKKNDTSFSIVSPTRTVDFEAADEAHKNEWIDLLAFLLRDDLNPSSFALIAKRKKPF